MIAAARRARTPAERAEVHSSAQRGLADETERRITAARARPTTARTARTTAGALESPIARQPSPCHPSKVGPGVAACQSANKASAAAAGQRVPRRRLSPAPEKERTTAAAER